MAAITPQMVKELRDKTDAGMGECKKALIEANGDIEAAVDILRKAGIAKSAHRADRATAEGKALMQEFGLPDGLTGIGALALGYPAAPPRDPKPRKENYYRIVK